jgi:4-amino-4-deoxy-L-arabinose transferase-like glycosyltransferase
VLAVFAVALLVRLVLVLPMPADGWKTAVSSDSTMDSRAYVDLARQISARGAFAFGERATAFRPPLYPAFLAGHFAVFGENFRAVRISQAVLGAVACVALAGTGLIVAGPLCGLLAGLALAVYPFAVYFAGETMTEGLFVPVATGAVYLAVRALKNGRVGAAALAGAVAGLAVLTRPTFLAFVGLLGAGGLIAWWRGHRTPGRAFVVIAFVAGLVVLPWVVRNSLLFGEPVFVTTYNGVNLYKGLPDRNDVTCMREFGYTMHTIEDASLAVLPKSEVEMDRELRAFWRRTITDNPGAYLREKLRDLGKFWFDFNLAGAVGKRTFVLPLLSFGAYLGVLLLGLVGTVVLARAGQWGVLAVAWTMILVTAGLTVPIFAGKRFRIPTVDPYLILIVAAWLENLRSRPGRAAGRT